MVRTQWEKSDGDARLYRRIDRRAKIRVANQLKTTTIPRLELQAFIVGIRLADKLLKELEARMVINRVILWSDSLVVLFWIANDENRYLPFIVRWKPGTFLQKKPENDVELRPKAAALLAWIDSEVADKCNTTAEFFKHRLNVETLSNELFDKEEEESH
ncbi:hypothetical protein M513_13589 [Trichuris suis]|uniref:Uncharacterized protein n=1 Tax=Trichuris suis TaxID=68888 RepID=A0A085LKP6_9BILA|nr:hypothetical protein M513_13589 [Trichuris suis]